MSGGGVGHDRLVRFDDFSHCHAQTLVDDDNLATLTQTTLTGLDMPTVPEVQTFVVQAASGIYRLRAAGFGIAFSDSTIILSTPQTVLGAEFTNTTYAALSMRDGDAFAKQFGGATGDDPDFLRLLIEGIDDLGESTGFVELMLADYRFADNNDDYIVGEWTWIELSGLGNNVKELHFALSSSDTGASEPGNISA